MTYSIDRPSLKLPADNILLHSCCAPCVGELMEGILEAGGKMTIFFYNPNIHPKKEYEIRKEENIRFAKKLGIPFVDGDYDSQNWFQKTKGLEAEPERGLRCSVCFDMRFEKTAQYAVANGFSVYTSSLSISRWKDYNQINDSGHRVAAKYEGLSFWDFNWRKKGGAQRMLEISKKENFYKQEYCGCSYSLRDTNQWRTSKGRDKVVIGKEYYK
ncbi:MAG: epoxyqueuosine reductase QueH [Bdellovibrionaceae bacterium]|nr:epoxyqueuosine reductase QueH [Pseudobdellovibrionaceae bacterium]